MKEELTENKVEAGIVLSQSLISIQLGVCTAQFFGSASFCSAGSGGKKLPPKINCSVRYMEIIHSTLLTRLQG